MAVQVARTILERARRYGRLRPSFACRVQESERFRKAELSASLQNITPSERLALFDMDGVLLHGRFIVELARRTGRRAALAEFLDRFDLPADERASRIAALFAGVPAVAFETCAKEMPLTPGAVEAVVGLRKAGYRVGIVTDSFDTAAEIIRRRVFADFTVANLMSFRNGLATGRLTPAPAMLHPKGCLAHKHCKVNALLHLVERLGISNKRVLAVGDGENDICMLQEAGCSIAFQPKTTRVRNSAIHFLSGTLSGILEIVKLSQPLPMPSIVLDGPLELQLA
jgi:HAD superfamily phosphoserine phosphatase-like hydrolase